MSAEEHAFERVLAATRQHGLLPPPELSGYAERLRAGEAVPGLLRELVERVPAPQRSLLEHAWRAPTPIPATLSPDPQQLVRPAPAQGSSPARVPSTFPAEDELAERTTRGEGEASGGFPTRIGPYAIEGELARGGMGVVLRARHLELGRAVAIKLLLAGPEASERMRERFRTEGRAAARLRHPNVIGVHEVGDDPRGPYLVMDLIEGESLGARIRRSGPLPPEAAARVVAELARALAYAHEHAVLHRDLKPDNVLLDERGHPVLTDFGLAREVDRQSLQLTQAGQLLGTPSYMAPEQAEGRPELVDRRTDIYGLGAILYEALTGRLPFEEQALPALLSALRERAPQRLRDHESQVPADLETVCLKCLEKDPLDRYATASELAEDLERWLRDEPIQARPPGAAGRARRWIRRNPLTSQVIFASLTILLGAGAGGAWLALEQVRRERDLAQAAREDAARERDAARAAQREAARERDEARAQRQLAAERLAASQRLLGQLFDERASVARAEQNWGASVRHLAAALEREDTPARRFALARALTRAWPEQELSDSQLLPWLYWSPDGRHLLACSASRVRLYQRGSPEPKLALEGGFRPGAAWSTDGQHFALRVLGRPPSQADQRPPSPQLRVEIRALAGALVERWEHQAHGLRWIGPRRLVSWTSSAARLHQLGVKEPARLGFRGVVGFGSTIRFSRDLSFLVAAGGGARDVVTWDLRSGKATRTPLPFQLQHAASMVGSAERPLLLGVKRACWAHFPGGELGQPFPLPPLEGSRAVAAGGRIALQFENSLAVLEPGSRPTPWPVALDAADVQLLWSPDGRRLGVTARARPLRLFNARGEQLASLDAAAEDLLVRGRFNMVGTRLVWSADSRALSFAAGSNLIVVTPDGDETARLSHAPEHVDTVSWAGGRNSPLATATKEAVRIWTPPAEASPRLPGASYAVSAPTGARVALCRPRELLVVGGERELRVPVQGVPRVSWSPSGKHLLVSQRGSGAVIRASDGHQAAKLRFGGRWLPQAPDRALFTRPPGGEDRGGSIWIVDAATGQETKLIAPPQGSLIASQIPRWTLSGRFFGLASTQPAHRLRLWSGVEPSELRLEPWEFPPRVKLGRGRSHCFDVSPQGDRAALLEITPERLVLHLRGGPSGPRELELPGPRVRGRGRNTLHFSPDGRYLVAGAFLSAYLVDPRDGEVHTLPGEVTGFAWSPSGDLLALEGARDVQLLHASSRDVLDRFPGKCGVSWSADGHKLYLARPRSTEVVEVPPLDQPAGQLLRRARELGFTR